ncbi:MAG: class I SAM-dependent methyltransferase [Verrucomicrobiae bacterium]|nr:class I SAM-dependent methyltransferase [Verrucomicrobiae bacterium]
MSRIPCLLFEDDDLLAVHKPPGIATHRVAPWAPEGLVEVLEGARPGVRLGIHQRLDRATSGVLFFAKSARANAALARQFERREVRKTYLLATAERDGGEAFDAKEPVDGKAARTRFCFERKLASGFSLWRAEPETGRTHQVRRHAAAHGLHIVGEPSHDGVAALEEFSPPLLLHAWRLEIRHPATGAPLLLDAPLPPWFEVADPHLRRGQAAAALRESLIAREESDAFRLVHREGDGFPRLTVDRLGDWLYAEDFSPNGLSDEELLAALPFARTARGLACSRAGTSARREAKRVVCGEPPPEELVVRENGLKFRLRPMAPGGIGLFFDQRENRRRMRELARGRKLLNLFAYTCAFSVAAARGGAAETVSVDISRRALECGRENFRLNGLDAEAHRFLAWDAREAVRRLGARGEKFHAIALDPPSFGRSKAGGAFSVKRDFATLAGEALILLEPGGRLLASTNFGGWGPREFEQALRAGAKRAGIRIAAFEWAPQGFDYPAPRGAPAHLKAAWAQRE